MAATYRSHCCLVTRIRRLACAATLVFLGTPAFGAGRAPPAVVAVQRIREGETITKDRLNVTPYLPTLSDATTFSTFNPIVGRVAIKEIAEGSVVPRASVGAKPDIQFKITPTTALRLHVTRRRGAVLPNAKQDYLECRLDTSTLLAPQAKALRDAVVASHVVLLPSHDFEQMEGSYEDYRMAITVGEVTRTLSWSIQGAPEAARRLAAKYLDGCAAAGGAP